jgi:two-component system capsular synthesis response regulator RcsB
MANQMIRVAVADDHPAVLIGIKHQLAAIDTIEVIGSAESSDELVELLDQHACDVLVTDYAMPGGNFGDGITLLTLLHRRHPGVKIVVVTMLANPGIVRVLIDQGFACIVSKCDALRHVVEAINAAWRGQGYLSPTLDKVIEESEQAATRQTRELSLREIEVVRLYVSGLTIKQIAAQLHRSKQTVSAQKVSAMKKLGIGLESDLFAYGHQMGFGTAGPGQELKGEDV